MAPFEIFLVLAVAFAAAIIYISVRMLREKRETVQQRAATQAEIGRRAAAKGRRFEGSVRGDAWKVQGTLAGGAAWTMAYAVAPDNDPSSRGALDWITGQQLGWRCPALVREARVFEFYSRTDKEKREQLGRLPPEEEVWQRWRLEFRDGPDEAIARRAFGPDVCALLARLPKGVELWEKHVDQRTSIVLGGDGLVAILGLDELTAELAELWIEIAEAVAGGLIPAAGRTSAAPARGA